MFNPNYDKEQPVKNNNDCPIYTFVTFVILTRRFTSKRNIITYKISLSVCYSCAGFHAVSKSARMLCIHVPNVTKLSERARFRFSAEVSFN